MQMHLNFDNRIHLLHDKILCQNQCLLMLRYMLDHLCRFSCAMKRNTQNLLMIWQDSQRYLDSNGQKQLLRTVYNLNLQNKIKLS